MQKKQVKSDVLKKFYITGAALALIIGLVVITTNKKSYAIDVEDNETNATLTLNCPETTTAGSVIECSIAFNTGNITAQAFQTNYEGQNGLEFQEFVPNSICTEDNCTYSATAIAYWKLRPTITGQNILGTVKYKVPNNASPNQSFQVVLTEGLLAYKDSNNDTQSVRFDELASTIRIPSSGPSTLSDINTLNNIILSTGTLNEEVIPSRNNYTATVNSDKVSISISKTDASSTISGNLNNISLNYGDNTITFKVISESGIENTYTIVINRPNSGTEPPTDPTPDNPTPDNPTPDDPEINDSTNSGQSSAPTASDKSETNKDKSVSGIPNTAMNSLKVLYGIGLFLLVAGAIALLTIYKKKNKK